ncbi:ABC transporter ATP-binding protein [Pseudoroseomonas deserti]|uniref:ABC transporter ATP-binding protein n=1 Tax=Teichococcus deserti TaxID=1817963 RepID=A0A1V2H7H5_9PROT|nr:ABC transporter ATP-binding protein [Pseudoroseomonas deserti]ONG56145.1 ABC transporter ATP-binding protein [Pseudoroseomonas deserti]
MTLRLEGIRHAYAARAVLQGVDLSVGPGEILCLLGPSGDGKTTLLRLVAGLEALQAGRIAIGERIVAEPGRELPPEDRRVGFVFQDYALFPHLTVAQNVGFGLGRMPRGERAAAVEAALARLGMAGFAGAWPHMLSGGQQQRVALARALAPRPAVLLLDEAFASLDARLREQVRDDTLRLLQNAGIATLIVTHDAEEAMLMADRIALMRGGRVEQLDPPEDLYLRPRSRFAASFLGPVNALPVTLRGGQAHGPLGSLPAALPDGEGELLLRPEGIVVLPEGEGVPATVDSCRMLGAHRLAALRLDSAAAPLQVRLPPGQALRPGARVGLALDPERAFVFAAEVPR